MNVTYLISTEAFKSLHSINHSFSVIIASDINTSPPITA